MPGINRLDVEEKQRVRAEIASQVEEFLRRGGRIDVVEQNNKGGQNAIGNVWHSHHELADLASKE